MTISVVQIGIANASTQGYTGNFASNVAAGNTVFLVVDGYGVSSPSSSNPTFNGSVVSGSVQIYPDTAQGSEGGTMWMLPNVSGGATGFGLTVSGYSNNSVCGIIALEVAGLGPKPLVGQHSEVNGVGNSFATSAGAIAHAPVLALGQVVIDGTYNTGPGVSWEGVSIVNSTPTPGGYLNNSNAYWQVAASAGGTYNITGNTSSDWIAAVVGVYAGTDDAGMLMAALP